MHKMAFCVNFVEYTCRVLAASIISEYVPASNAQYDRTSIAEGKLQPSLLITINIQKSKLRGFYDDIAKNIWTLIYLAFCSVSNSI